MNLTDDWLLDDPTMGHSRRVTQFALFLLWLADGHTINGNFIKAATMENYLRSIGTLIKHRTGRDPRYDNAGDKKMSDRLHVILDEIKRWERVPNKKRPYTHKMHKVLMAMAAKTNAHEDSALAAAVNWFAVNLQLGCRLQEWAQSDDNRKLGAHAFVEGFGARAFTLSDLSFKDIDGRKVSLEAFLADESKVQTIEFCWRVQKNRQNGETLSYDRNTTDTAGCMVRNMWQILHRFKRLIGLHEQHTPIAVYNAPGEGIIHMHKSIVDKILQTVAMRTYHLTPEEALDYTSHSLRIGACVLLHMAGADEKTLKQLLRWRSNAFMEYLRQLPRIRQLHNDAISLAIAESHLY